MEADSKDYTNVNDDQAVRRIDLDEDRNVVGVAYTPTICHVYDREK